MYVSKMYVAFVDFLKAFDSVWHSELLDTIQKEGVSGKFAGAIKAMYISLLSCSTQWKYVYKHFPNVPVVYDKDVY